MHTRLVVISSWTVFLNGKIEIIFCLSTAREKKNTHTYDKHMKNLCVTHHTKGNGFTTLIMITRHISCVLFLFFSFSSSLFAFSLHFYGFAGWPLFCVLNQKREFRKCAATNHFDIDAKCAHAIILQFSEWEIQKRTQLHGRWLNCSVPLAFSWRICSFVLLLFVRFALEELIIVEFMMMTTTTAATYQHSTAPRQSQFQKKSVAWPPYLLVNPSFSCAILSC